MYYDLQNKLLFRDIPIIFENWYVLEDFQFHILKQLLPKKTTSFIAADVSS